MLMVVGIGMIGVLTASVASFFIGQGVDEEKAALQLRLDKIEGMLAQALAQGAGSGVDGSPIQEPAIQPIVQD